MSNSGRDTADAHADRIATITIGETAVIYDRENHRAWIQGEPCQIRQ